jgi:5-methylcytosine-specific restriction protein A
MEMEDKKLEKEYEETFDGEEKALNLLHISSDKYTRRKEVIKIKEIGFSEPIKKGRSQTMTGLTKSISEMGVMNPIHVMTTELSEDDDDDAFKYVLLDGLRRVFGAVKNNVGEIEAIIWDFHDKELGRQVALVLSLLLNRTQRRKWKEIWDLYTVLEMQTQITPGTLEYLLQLEPGDAMKLKDVMLCEYVDVQEMILHENKTLEQAYKQLQKLRKEEDALSKEDNMGIGDTMEEASEIANDEPQSELLTDNDVVKLLELSDSMDEDDIDEADFEEMNAQGEVEHQKVGERHPVDPSIKQGTFQRDNYRCRCCNTGGVAFLGTLIYHHLVPVADGGPDTVDNGLTLCDSCHQILHITQKNGGRINMTKGQFDEYSEDEQRRIKYILKFAKVAVEADKIRGRNKEEIMKDANASARHRMPGESMKEMTQMYASSQKEEE